MAIDDLIEKALDSAEERISEANPDPVEPTEAPESEVEQEDQPLAAEKQISDKEANVEEDKAPQGDAEAEKPALNQDEPIELPAFLSAETKALLAEASPALRKKMVAEYEQRENTTRRALHESSTLKAEKARVDEVITPHKTRLAAMGIRDTSDLVSRAVAWDELMTKDIKGFLRAQLQQNGLSANDLFEDAGNDPGGSQYQDPRVEEALEEARAAKRQFEYFQLNQTRAELTKELEVFKDSQDSTGVKRRAFVDMFQPQIAETIKLIKADPDFAHLDRNQVLHEAYEYVVSQARASGFQFAPPVAAKPVLTAEQIAANASKQRAASGSVRGAPASGTSTPRAKLKGETFEQRLESAMDKAESRTNR